MNDAAGWLIRPASGMVYLQPLEEASIAAKKPGLPLRPLGCAVRSITRRDLRANRVADATSTHSTTRGYPYTAAPNILSAHGLMSK